LGSKFKGVGIEGVRGGWWGGRGIWEKVRLRGGGKRRRRGVGREGRGGRGGGKGAGG